MRIVVAPDSLKGTAAAASVAASLARGWLAARPGDEVLLFPMADGGEGTLDAFDAAVHGSERHAVTVTGPAGTPVGASWLLLPDGTAVVELASTSGIELLPPDALRPFDAGTRGFGEAIAAALDAGAERLLLAVGSSSSTDAGAGALQALGATIADVSGTPIAPGARGLADVARVDLEPMRPLPIGGAIVISDVTNPLLGPAGAASVFGPQKGASPGDIEVIERAVARFAALVAIDPTTPGSGAAGGSGFGLLAWGASLSPGAPAVAEALDLAAALATADVVITGEGRFDVQSESGKVPTFVRDLAARHGVPALLVAGLVEADAVGFADVVSLTDLAGSGRASRSDPSRYLEEAGALLARRLDPRP